MVILFLKRLLSNFKLFKIIYKETIKGKNIEKMMNEIIIKY